MMDTYKTNNIMYDALGAIHTASVDCDNCYI